MNEKTYELSVIVPIYNPPAELLKNCIHSILSQKGFRFELILIDDGSTNGAAEYLDTIRRDNVRILHKQNEGVSAARNLGLAMSGADYVMFVDADDFLVEDAFQRFKKYMEEDAADVIIGKMVRVGSLGDDWHRVTTGSSSPLETAKDLSLLQEMLFFKDQRMRRFGSSGGEYSLEGIHGKFFKRSALGEIRFNTDLAISEDTLFNFRLFRKEGITVNLIDDILYIYVQNPDSVLHAYNPHMVERIRKTLQTFESAVSADEREIYLSYIHWKIGKLQQLIGSYFFAKDDKRNIFDIKNELKYLCTCEPWKFGNVEKIDLKSKVKIRFIQSGYMVIYMAVKRKILHCFNQLKED